MSGLETIALATTLGATAASTVLGYQGAKYQAETQSNALKYDAKVKEQQAAEATAVAQRQAEGKRKEANLLISRQRAVAAASGGGTGGTVSDLMQQAAGAGEYNAQAAMYQGEAQATSLRDQAALNRVGAQNAIQAGNMQAAGAIISGVSAMASRFAGSGFKLPTMQAGQPMNILPPGSGGYYYGS